MLLIERYINDLFSSNCYVIFDDCTNRCVIVDPASERACEEIAFIESRKLVLDYILLTHEHADHTLGCGALIEEYPDARILCTKECKKALSKEWDLFNRCYFEKPHVLFEINKIDKTVEDYAYQLSWSNETITFVKTPGHSAGSMTIAIGASLFTGDSLMQYKPYISKKSGGSKDLYAQSRQMLIDTYPPYMLIYPGHGDSFLLKDSYKLLDLK